MWLSAWEQGSLFQFAAVAALNEARQTYTEAVKAEPPPQPLVVQPVKKITPTTISAPQKTIYASASEPVTRRYRPLYQHCRHWAHRKSAWGSNGFAELTVWAQAMSLGPPNLRNLIDPPVPVERLSPSTLCRLNEMVEGYVIVRLTIDETGRVKDVLVVDSEPLGIGLLSGAPVTRLDVLSFFRFQSRWSICTAESTIEKRIVFSLK